MLPWRKFISLSGKEKGSIFSTLEHFILDLNAPARSSLDLLHKSEKLTISNFGFWILDFGLRDLGLLQEVY
jgi:hypothetical protein